jgi:hypothetical protein
MIAAPGRIFGASIGYRNLELERLRALVPGLAQESQLAGSLDHERTLSRPAHADGFQVDG